MIHFIYENKQNEMKILFTALLHRIWEIKYGLQLTGLLFFLTLCLLCCIPTLLGTLDRNHNYDETSIFQ